MDGVEVVGTLELLQLSNRRIVDPATTMTRNKHS